MSPARPRHAHTLVTARHARGTRRRPSPPCPQRFHAAPELQREQSESQTAQTGTGHCRAPAAPSGRVPPPPPPDAVSQSEQRGPNPSFERIEEPTPHPGSAPSTAPRARRRAPPRRGSRPHPPPRVRSAPRSTQRDSRQRAPLQRTRMFLFFSMCHGASARQSSRACVVKLFCCVNFFSVPANPTI